MHVALCAAAPSACSQLASLSLPAKRIARAHVARDSTRLCTRSPGRSALTRRGERSSALLVLRRSRTDECGRCDIRSRPLRPPAARARVRCERCLPQIECILIMPRSSGPCCFAEHPWPCAALLHLRAALGTLGRASLTSSAMSSQILPLEVRGSTDDDADSPACRQVYRQCVDGSCAGPLTSQAGYGSSCALVRRLTTTVRRPFTLISQNENSSARCWGSTTTSRSSLTT